MERPKHVPVVTESYGKCLITSLPQFVSNAWVPYAFAVWRESGKVRFERFSEFGDLVFPTKSEALSAGFSAGRIWADEVRQHARRTRAKVVRLFK